MQHLRLIFALTYTFILLTSCNSNLEEKQKTTPEDPVAKKDTPAPDTKPSTVNDRPPIINIMDTVSVKRIVLCLKDSAASLERISVKLGVLYGTKLAAVIKNNNLKVTGRPMAWYNTTKAPYYFEAGLPVDKKPVKLPGNFFIKEIGTDSVIVAHFYGTYLQMPLAYDALKDWMKAHKKTLKGKPYEVYVDDPVNNDGKLKDPYKVQTDIVFTWR